MEDNVWRKMTFGGTQPSVEDDLWWKTIFGGRQPLVEDDLKWKTTFGGRQLLVEDDLRWKTTLRFFFFVMSACIANFSGQNHIPSTNPNTLYICKE